MTDLEALHRAILEDPACDTRRLVYADALDETGKARDAARAELIRAQIQGDPVVDAEPILKRWGESFLPEPLRRANSSYPNCLVSGCIMSSHRMVGHLTFRRGFLATVNVVLPWRPDDLTPALERLCGHVRATFAWNPLESITVSFEGHPATLTAEITNGHPWSAVEPIGTGWRIGWDMQTYELWNTVQYIVPPQTCSTRAELGRELSGWLTAAIREPAMAVAMERQREIDEANGPEQLPWPDADEVNERSANGRY